MRVAMLLSNDCTSDPRVEKEAAALAAAGHQVTVFAWGRDPAVERETRRDGWRVVRLGPAASHGGGIRNLGPYRQFWRDATAAVTAWAADVVHCHDADTIPAGLAVRRRLRTCRLVLDLHERYDLSRMIPQRGVVGTAARTVVRALERRAVSKADLVIVANPGTAPHYRAMGAGRRLLVVDNAPDTELFRPLACAEPAPGLTITFIGRIRYPRTLEALMEAAADVPGARVVIAGSGPDEERVRAAAAGAAHVEVHGHIPYADIPSWYACSDVVFAAYDTLVGNALVATPGKVLEALACGVPVIVSEGTFIGRWVTEHGVGATVDSVDAGSIRAALKRLAEDPDAASEMGRAGRDVIADGLDWDAASSRLVAAYENW